MIWMRDTETQVDGAILFRRTLTDLLRLPGVGESAGLAAVRHRRVVVMLQLLQLLLLLVMGGHHH